MNAEQLHACFEKHNGDYSKFHNIPAYARMHERQDLCAFLYLHSKLGGTGDMVAAAEHDEIYLDGDAGELARLTEEDVIYLIRCGVRYDSKVDSLCLFV